MTQISSMKKRVSHCVLSEQKLFINKRPNLKDFDKVNCEENMRFTECDINSLIRKAVAIMK